MSKELSKNFKTVVIGDGAVGKTCLLTIFDNYQEIVKSRGVDYTLQLWDTAGQEEFSKLRVLSYDDSDCFIICFSLVNRVSFTNVRSRWYPDLVKSGHEKTPIILVGTKNDLRKDLEYCRNLEEGGEVSKPIDDEEAYELACDIKAFKFIKTSALTRENINQTFQEIVEHLANIRSGGKNVRNKKKKKKKKKKKGGGLSGGFMGGGGGGLSDLMMGMDTLPPVAPKEQAADSGEKYTEESHDWVRKNE